MLGESAVKTREHPGGRSHSGGGDGQILSTPLTPNARNNNALG